MILSTDLRGWQMCTHITDAGDVGVCLASLQQLRGLNHWLHHFQCSAVMQPLFTQPLLYLAQVIPETFDKYNDTIWENLMRTSCSQQLMSSQLYLLHYLSTNVKCHTQTHTPTEAHTHTHKHTHKQATYLDTIRYRLITLHGLVRLIAANLQPMIGSSWTMYSRYK